MQKHDKPFTKVINPLRAIHPIASPSLGFICQLIVYYKRGFKVSDQNTFWAEYRNLLRIVDHDRLEEYETRQTCNDDNVDRSAVYSCAKCRQTLFYGANVVRHVPASGSDEFGTEPCSSIFVEPMDWMVGMDAQSGKITCKNSRCSSKLGYYCWHGRRCSCGHLQIPAFQIQLSKIDKLPVESRLGGSTPNRNDDLL
ncbi:Dual specificity protein phosphatase 12 [Babesia sp. Xinjiang]|uniref:Dual specificity protein phosphatase 12 n=1 Tax=Babesia sp. Xinjiang TaxID=462227 RepID=UPI000A24DAAF|nr:Dual specificity protein phosphatase 12 [Babesia sp. Xinjiang]ORM41932.1 Dual specificity protein phosphatase 12 [Babesia sp. Xinjiang]